MKDYSDYKSGACGRLLYRFFNLFKHKGSINSFWFTGTNFGDGLNPFFISHITGKKSINVSEFNKKNKEHYIVIGSSIEKATEKSIIWGAGYIGKDRIFRNKPLRICAVRGPKTREELLKQGVECPEVYGDPALLLPYLYTPKIEKKYELGIIPHYVDRKNEWLQQFAHSSSVKIIDIRKCNPLNVINDILACEKIASSSLHGIIVADAYGISSTWVEFSDKVAGEGFKFDDYYLSVGRELEKPLKVTNNTTLEEVIKRFKNYSIDIDLTKLIKACPFPIELKKL